MASERSDFQKMNHSTEKASRFQHLRLWQFCRKFGMSINTGSNGCAAWAIYTLSASSINAVDALRICKAQPPIS